MIVLVQIFRISPVRSSDNVAFGFLIKEIDSFAACFDHKGFHTKAFAPQNNQYNKRLSKFFPSVTLNSAALSSYNHAPHVVRDWTWKEACLRSDELIRGLIRDVPLDEKNDEVTDRGSGADCSWEEGTHIRSGVSAGMRNA